MTIPVTEELERLEQYLTIQPADLRVDIDTPVPADRYIIPDSLSLIVQHAQRYNTYPLHISIGFLKHHIEITYPVQPRIKPDESFADIETLVALYRNYFNLPSVQQTSEKITISIPLFI